MKKRQEENNSRPAHCIGLQVQSGKLKSRQGVSRLPVLLAALMSTLFLIGAFPECSAAFSNPHAHAETFEMGQIVKLGDTYYTVRKAWWADTLGRKYPYPARNSFLFVQLTIRNAAQNFRGAGKFTLIDQENIEFDMAEEARELENAIRTLKRIQGGDKMEGVLVFDVPKGKTYRLQISGGMWSTGKAFINLRNILYN